MPKRRQPHRGRQRGRQELQQDSLLPNETAAGERYPGLVITRFGATVEVEDENGVLHRCTSRRKLGDIICGDRVIWQPTINEEGVVLERLERNTLLSRPDDVGRERPIAANIDQIIVVATVQENRYHLNHNLIDRYCVAAERLNITPVLVFNKIDLLDDTGLAQLQADTAVYRDIGYTMIHASTKKNIGIDLLAAQLNGHTSVFVGESGVGKSSLINLFLPDTEVKVGEVSELSGKGKHTTTGTTLYHLPNGGHLIDSPGVREFGLGRCDRTDIAYGFIEFRPYVGQCKFNNCSHRMEPGCAIIIAVEKGEIQKRRYDNYLEIAESVAAMPSR